MKKTARIVVVFMALTMVYSMKLTASAQTEKAAQLQKSEPSKPSDTTSAQLSQKYARLGSSVKDCDTALGTPKIASGENKVLHRSDTREYEHDGISITIMFEEGKAEEILYCARADLFDVKKAAKLVGLNSQGYSWSKPVLSTILGKITEWYREDGGSAYYTEYEDQLERSLRISSGDSFNIRNNVPKNKEMYKKYSTSGNINGL